jgi:RNA-directed DNA polymerase
MHDAWKSDRCIVPEKPANKGETTPAESVEGRQRVKGNSVQMAMLRTQSRGGVTTELDRVREAARRDKRAKFTALLHHVSVDLLRTSFYELKRDAATGIDGLTWGEYEGVLEERLKELHGRIHRGSYRAMPSRRTYIPKGDGGRRPLGVAALEDKIVQKAVTTVLNGIYEVDFLGFSYGFRPGRGAQQALDALWVGLVHRKVNWVLDADIRGFFDTIDHEWMLKFIEHRIGDHRIIRLIAKWLKAGVMEDGRWTETSEGTPQGAVVSPLLANVYLHYVFDLWVQQWRSRYASGEVIVVRYADDFVLGFQHREDGERFLQELRERLAKFGLALHPDKTRLIEFGRFADENRRRRGQGKPETFNFLGFTHYCGKTRTNGKFTIWRKTIAQRLAAKLKVVKETLMRRRDEAFADLAAWLAQMVRGYFNYFAVPGNCRALETFRNEVKRHWLRALRRRSQRWRMAWARFGPLADAVLPPARITQAYPSERFYARYPRQEPYAVVPHVRICAGGAG